MKEQRKHYEPEILHAVFRRVFGTDHPSVGVIACEHPTTLRLVNSIYDAIVRELCAAEASGEAHARLDQRADEAVRAVVRKREGASQ